VVSEPIAALALEVPHIRGAALIQPRVVRHRRLPGLVPTQHIGHLPRDPYSGDAPEEIAYISI